MDVQFSDHAIDRVMNRLHTVVNYAEVQQAVSHARIGAGQNSVLVKRLPVAITIPTLDKAVDGILHGDKVIAKVEARNGGAFIMTVILC